MRRASGGGCGPLVPRHRADTIVSMIVDTDSQSVTHFSISNFCPTHPSHSFKLEGSQKASITKLKEDAHAPRLTHVPNHTELILRSADSAHVHAIVHRCMTIYCTDMPRHATPRFATPFGALMIGLAPVTSVRD